MNGKLVILLIVVSTLFCCERNGFRNEGSNHIQLRVGEVGSFEGTDWQVRLESIPRDNRCPVTARCFAPAPLHPKVRLKLENPRFDPMWVTIGSLHADVIWQQLGWKVEVLSASPERTLERPIAPEEYLIELGFVPTP